jgi:hypothetical protein
MAKKFTFQDYWKAINPNDPVPLKESILRRAHEDLDDDRQNLKRLIDKAYPCGEVC